MTAKRPPKKAPAKAGAKTRPKRLPLGSMPLPKGESTDLTDAEQDWLTSEVGRIEGLEAVINALAPEDFELIKQGLGASIGFSNLQGITRDIEARTGIDEREEWNRQETLYYLRIVQTGYKLAMRIANTALEDRGRHVIDAIASARKAAEAKWDKDPAGRAMREVRREWDEWQTKTSSFSNDAAFARAMLLKYQEITSEGSIKNACTRWRKEQKSS